MDKKELLNAVYNNEAEYVGEEYICKDCWKQEYKYKGVAFFVNVYGYERWVEEDQEMVEIKL